MESKETFTFIHGFIMKDVTKDEDEQPGEGV
jgi:hypothetical protein